MVSSATYGCNDDYIGLALPMDINDMFHIRDSAYFQQRISPPSEERKRFLFGDGDGKTSLCLFSLKLSETNFRESILILVTALFRRPPCYSSPEATIQHL